MATTLYRAGFASVTVRDPDEGYQATWEHLGHSERTLNGTLRRHYIARKAVWGVTWSHLTQAERSTLVTQLQFSVPMKWSPPDEATEYDVLVDTEYIMVPTNYGWTVSATLRQI